MTHAWTESRSLGGSPLACYLPMGLLAAGTLLTALLLSSCASLPRPKPGLYVNEEHRFSLTYPETWRDAPLQPDEVLRANGPSPYKLPVVTAAVAERPEGASLNPTRFTEAMAQRVPGASGFRVLSQEDVTLNDSTPAKAFLFEWLWKDGQTKMMTAALVAMKDGKFYNATVTNVPGAAPPPEGLLEIVKSWRFY